MIRQKHARNVEHCTTRQPHTTPQVFSQLAALYTPDAVGWNTLLSGYARCGDAVSARQLVARAQAAGFTPDAYTWSSLVQVRGPCM